MEQFEVINYDPETVKERVVNNMKGLGVYKPEFDDIINIYCDLLVRYHEANERFKESGYLYETSTAAGGTKKSATFAALENLWKNLLMYSDRLCLNPKSLRLEPPNEELEKDKPKSESPLEDFLGRM